MAWDPEGHAGVEGNRYIALKQTYEQDLKAKILNALCYIPNVTVETNVELARQRSAPQGQTRHGANPVKDRPATTRGNRNGQTGTENPNTEQPNTAAVLKNLFGGLRGDNAESEADAADPVADEQIEKQSAGLTPVSARASVSVPLSYFRKVWQERNPVEAGRGAKTADPAALDRIRIEESAKIQRHVAQLLPSIESAAKATELVTVTTFQDIAVAELPAPEFRQEVLSWARQSWRMLGTIGLALISLLVLRSMVCSQRSAAEVEPAAARPGPTVEEAGSKVDELENSSYDRAAAVPPPHARGFYDAQNAGPVLRDELSELVEDDPEAAANVLRSWIGKVE